MKCNLTSHWYRSSLTIVTLLLLPFSWLFTACVAVRRVLFQYHILKSHRFPVPVIVVGNLTVGGTGKTPFVIWLANTLREQGYCPGIVSRGVGGRVSVAPHLVLATDVAEKVGDEALLLVRHANAPLVIGKDRVKAVHYLLQQFNCDIVISDDGLQHYRLARDIEIAMVDQHRQYGNECLLPAGPLREPMSRLKQVNFQVITGGKDENAMTLVPLDLIPMSPSAKLKPLRGETVHGVAAIGNPARFFTQIELEGFTVIQHAFPDHYLYRAQDLNFSDSLPILMTEKDAVKCENFADDRYWYLKITAKISDTFKEKLLVKIKSLKTTLGEQQNDYEDDFADCDNGKSCPLRNSKYGEDHSR